MQRLSVLFPAPLGCYDYKSETPVCPGQFIKAPFGRKTALGVVWNQAPDLSVPESKIKNISETVALNPLPPETIRFVNWVAGYTLSPAGMVLKMALIPEPEKTSKKPITFQEPDIRADSVSFSEAQAAAVQKLCAQIDGGFHVSLLDGVTGSGKTEVYFEAIAAALKHPGQVLILLPEITLTSAWLNRFEKRFGVKPAVWHSAITPKQRRDTWRAVLNGEARVIVGARSALFLPYSKLNLIIVDEEHDASYKQEDGILYQARDMAIVRAKLAGCPIILASATPSVETYCNVLNGKYDHIRLPERFSGAEFPDIRIVDMRRKEKGSTAFVSPELKKAIAEKLAEKEQSLLFINRRGYAPLVLCRACGERLQCPHCSAWLVEHRQKGYLQCHHCGYTRRIPSECPSCHEKDTLISCGPGVERIFEEINHIFPNARCEMVTSDTLANPAVFTALSEKMAKGEIDILIGTQILAKGHNFPNLTLVGVIDADMGLAGGDLRASERTFQLLHQVMGRAGRDRKKGTAILQSYSPENLIIQALQANDREHFMNEEILSRRLLGMPPFGRLAAVIVSGRDQNLTYQTAAHLAKTAPFLKEVSVLGPAAAPLAVLRGKYRFRLLIKTTKEFKLQNMLKTWLGKIKIPASVDVRLDIDPYSFF